MSDVDEFLMHFGVPGMKWGKRKASSESSSSGTKSSKAPRQPMSKKKKIAIAVGIGAVAAIGTAVALKSMNKNMDLPISSLRRTPQAAKGRAAAERVVVPRPPTIGNRPAPAPAARPSGGGLSLGNTNRFAGQTTPAPTGQRAAPSRAQAPRQSATSPSLSALNNLINSQPRITYDPKTGRYETK